MDGALPVDVADLQRLVRELDARVQDRDLRVSAHESVIAEQRDQRNRPAPPTLRRGVTR